MAPVQGHCERSEAILTQQSIITYQLKGDELRKQGADEQAELKYQMAVVLWQVLFSQHSDTLIDLSDACYYLGQYYRKNGDYEKSNSYYQKVVDEFPQYHLSWNALFVIGDNYQKLSELGVISKTEANQKTIAAYQKLLQDYPDCKAAKVAQNWLNKNSN